MIEIPALLTFAGFIIYGCFHIARKKTLFIDFAMSGVLQTPKAWFGTYEDLSACGGQCTLANTESITLKKKVTGFFLLVFF